MRTHGAGARWLLLVLLISLLTPGQALAAAYPVAQPLGRVATPTAPGALEDGATAIVASGGGCLNLRAAASTAAAILTCIPDGSAVGVMAGTAIAEGLNWRQVRYGPRTGWVAELYLRESAGTPGVQPGCALTEPSTPPAVPAPPVAVPTPEPVFVPPSPLLSGLPKTAGFGLTVWSGGSVEAMQGAALDAGCLIASVWGFDGDGQPYGYVFGAPAFVNEAWSARYPGDVPANTPLIAVCSGSARPTTPGETSGGGLTRTSTDATAVLRPPAVAAAPQERFERGTAVNLTPAPWALPPIAVRAIPPPTTQATSVLMLDGSSGAIMYEKNARGGVHPASLTKIATAVIAIEQARARFDTWVTVDVDSRVLVATTGSSVMGLRPGDCFQLRDLLYGLMLPSGNDAALAIARYVSGSDEAFVGEMNGLAARLGIATTTHFENPHGLTQQGHRASAYDLAVLARYAMSMPEFTSLVGTRSWVARGSNTISFLNSNAFLARYTGADGVKTGYTEEAGRTLVASVTKNGRRVFVAILNSNDREGDAQKMFDWAYANFVWG